MSHKDCDLKLPDFKDCHHSLPSCAPCKIVKLNCSTDFHCDLPHGYDKYKPKTNPERIKKPAC